MKFFLRRLHKPNILIFAIVLFTSSFVQAEQLETRGFIDDLENAISENLHNVVDFFEDIFHINHHTPSKFNYDATIVGFVNFADGIGRHPILFKECLDRRVNMNFLSTRNIPVEVEDAQLGLPRLNPANKNDIGAVAILVDILADKALSIYKKMPDSHIKIAYTMFESTEIPSNWAPILNTKFDMAVVTDQFMIDVYRNCGVQIPIFVLPLPLMLHNFLELKPRTEHHKPFVFGMSGGFWKRKNHVRVLDAFAREFGNSKNVKLKLHGRFGEEEIIKELSDKIAKYGLTNVELIVRPYTWEEYLEFFKSLDCYVFLSMGEGFSITPREALACGIPCILTNNTAQISICKTGLVRTVRSEILVPAEYDCHYDNSIGLNGRVDEITRLLQFGEYEILNDLGTWEEDLDLMFRSGTIGYQFDCTLRDARNAMRDVYKNYREYLELASHGRKWVRSYLRENLSDKYVSMIKPESVILGKENIIGNKFLMTNSKKLYEKYQSILDNK